jgi:hypothetical protein
MANTNYHKSINKTLILENYFDILQKKLLLGDNHSEHPGFANGILKDFGEGITNTWNILSVINKVVHSTARNIFIKLQIYNGLTQDNRLYLPLKKAISVCYLKQSKKHSTIFQKIALNYQ